jgi:hypothetical protein
MEMEKIKDAGVTKDEAPFHKRTRSTG